MLFEKSAGRLLAITMLCSALALVAATNVAAYPITPEGEPLYLEAGATPSLAPDPVLKPVDSGAGASAPGAASDVLPLEESSSSGIDWIETALVATAAIALVAVAATAFTRPGHRRRSARAS